MSKIFSRDFDEVCYGRFDAEYYKDEFVELEQIIQKKTNLKLSDFILSISSGATPDKKESWKYYTEDKTKGIPFLRVQNIKPNTTISDDFIYINAETHERMLKRSQVFEDDLIITITGRLGTAAVAPKGFVGNINQHSVVIKTKNLEISRAIATFLNTSIGEKLATRRATGGTRPALDYKSLKSIPIVYNEQIYSIIEKANQQSKTKEQKAKELLDSIDEYLLSELGIIMPQKSNNILENRIFMQNFSNINNTRFDPNYHQKYYQDLEQALTQSIYPLVNLSQIITSFKKGIEVGSEAYSQTKEIPFIRVSDIDNEGISYDKVEKFITTSLYENLKSFQPQQNELLYSKDGTIGFCLRADTSRDYIISGGILRLEFKKEVNIDFVQNILASHLLNVLANRKAIGAVIKHLGVNEFLNLKIPLPPLAMQEKLVHSIQECKEKATLLKNQAKEILNAAKINVENMILATSAGGGDNPSRN